MAAAIITSNKRPNPFDDNNSSQTPFASDNGNKRQNTQTDAKQNNTPTINFVDTSKFLPSVEFDPETTDMLHFLAQDKSAAERGVTAAQMVQEFSRFMLLKAITKDTDDAILYPTEVMHALWHKAILHTKCWDSVQRKIGLRVHHNFALDCCNSTEYIRKRQTRYLETCRLYELLWQTLPLLARKAEDKKANKANAAVSKIARDNGGNEHLIDNLVTSHTAQTASSPAAAPASTLISPLMPPTLLAGAMLAAANVAAISKEQSLTEASKLVKITVFTAGYSSTDNIAYNSANSLEVSLDKTVVELQRVIEIMLHIPILEQQLSFLGCPITDAKATLRSLHITDGSRVRVNSTQWK
jgi:hypothetical protein